MRRINDPRRAGGLTANTPHFMILLGNIMVVEISCIVRCILGNDDKAFVV